MAINKKIISSILPILQTLRMQKFIDQTSDVVITKKASLVLNVEEMKFQISGITDREVEGKSQSVKVAKELKLLIKTSDVFDVKLNGVHRTFIIIDLDERAIPIDGYNKETWKNCAMVLRYASDGSCLKLGEVVNKSGSLTGAQQAAYSSIWS